MYAHQQTIWRSWNAGSCYLDENHDFTDSVIHLCDNQEHYY
jgi:hypothetical protein